jgi:DNA-binding FrmR family transcriptional regulator
MSHLAQHKNKLTARLKRIRGQMDAVQRALDDDTECFNILQLVAAARGGMNALMAELMADHLIHHVVEPEHGEDPHQGAEELIDIFRTYLR